MRREQVDHPIEVLDLSVRAYNSLKRAGINWASQVLSLTDDELLDIQGIGISTLGGIKIRLERYRKAMLVRPVQQQSTPPLTQADPAQVEPSPGDVSIDVLDLSARAHNCLIRSQVRTISQLAVLTDEQLLDIRNLGVGCLAEIRQKIEAYLQKHPEGRKLPTVSSEEQRPPPAPRYRPPLVPVELRARAAKLPLEDISVARLLLPSKDADFLSRCEISSVAMLMEQPADAFVPGSPVPERVNRYLQWLVRQDEKTWREEVAGQRISPMHSLLLEGETLDDLTTRWLEAIGERERRVLEGRFAGRTLEEIGQELGLTRERIRQLETRAIKRLKGVRLQLSVASLDALLAQALTDAGGLMTADEAREVLVETVTIGTADVAWSTWLLLNTSGQLQELSAEQLWGLASRPLHLVPVIRHCLTELHAAGVRPTSGDELLSHLTATELLEPLKGELDAAFVAACYRTMRLPSIPAQVPMPEQRLKLPTRQDVPPERGEPKGLSFKLYEWEQRLRPLVGQVELLGEIPLTAEETTDLAKAVDARLRKTKLSEVVSIFRRQYPCSLAVFLVAQGVYGYSGVDGYWPNVSRALGRNLHPGWTGQLGLLFETVLTDLGLPLFPDLGGHRFVTLILLHGGIPDYCLDDFFANMLQPGVTRARYAGMSAAELIEEWRWRASGRHVTDKPVLYFLEFGGLVAQDFCERCLEMARETAESGIVPEAAEVGLPPRVVSAYSRWIAEQDIAQVRREAGDRWGLRKPEVRADPWGEGILLELPPQQVPVMAIQADIAWQIQVGETMLSVPVRVRRSGFDWKTVPESIALAQPAAQYEAMLLADGEPKRSWLFQGVDDSRPILAFDLDTGAQLPWAYSLPARCLALFYPADRELSVEGDAQVLEEYERLPRGWTSYRGQAWDLRQARALTLASPTRETLTVTLRVDEGAQRPFLEEGRLLSAGKPGTAAPVYLGAPPRIRIPLSGRRALEEELALWRVMIQNRWAASPELQRTQTLAELRDQAAAGDGYVDLLLHHPGLLGQTPFGNYQVRLRGPLGRDADLSLRMVPYLDVSGHQDLYLPDPTAGPQPALLQVEALAEYGLECQGEDGDCHLKEIGQVGSKRRYEVEADPGVTAVDVTLLKALPTGDVVRVPVPVPIRRLRWSLADEGAAVGQREWSGVAIKQSVDAFLEAHAPCLLVDLPIQDLDPVQLQLRLVDVDGVERQVLESPPPRRGQQRWRFELGAFADTVRHAWQSPTLRFELVAYGLQSEKKGLYWPVLSLTRPLLVENVSLTVRRAGKRAAFELRWHEPRPLRNRVVRFWPLWRPWDPVFEQPIPDDADGAFTFDAPHDRLRSGKVRLEFLVVDPWVPQEAVKPTAGSPGTVEVELISAKKQLQALDNRLEGHEDLLQIDERVSELVRELQQRLRAFDSLYEERALVLEEESVLLPELLDATVEFHNVLTAGFEQYRFHKSCRQSCADSPAQGAGAAPFRKPKTPAILSFDMNALEAAGDRHTEAVRRFKAVVSAESFCQEISNAFGELTRQLSDGTEADIELARNNIEIERRKVVARASNAGETLGKIRSAQQPQRAVLAQAVRELNTNLKQWVVAVRDGGKKHSEYLEEVKSKVMRFLDKLRKARRQGDFSDPEIDQYWAGIEARVLEGAEEIENLLQSGLVAEKDRDRASQAGKLKQHFELLLERAVIYADMGDLEKAQADAQWCYENLDVGTVPEILSLVDLVGSTRDTSTMRALQLKMFAASRFEPILRAREAGTLPQEQFDAYLANLPRSGLVPLTTCRLLLTVDDETARLHAVQQLLTRESPDGVEAVLSWVEAATMSDDDAISLLTQKPDFAAEALRAREGRPTADRLLQAFSQKAENVVRVGSWLRCNLGWGRIDGIEHRDSGASVRWCIGGSSPYRLTVTLRPDEHAEIVCIDLLSSTAEFVEPGYVRTCTECEQFSTQDLDLLSKHHLAAHRQGTPQDRKYFRDGFARFRVEESRSIPLSSFELVSVKPSKQLV